MKIILIILVLVLAVVVFLTNYENPWQHDIKTALRASEPEKAIPEAIPELIVLEDKKVREVLRDEDDSAVTLKNNSTLDEVESRPLVIQPAPTETAIKKKHEASNPIQDAKPQFKEQLIEGENAIPIKDEETPQPIRRITAKEVRKLMGILTESRNKLLGIDESMAQGDITPAPGSTNTPKDYRKNSRTDELAVRKWLKQVAIELDLDPQLALGMAKVESGYDATAISPKGAIGVLQVMPETARRYFGKSRDELFDPETNIRLGLLLMKRLMDQFDQNLDLALAAYNAGADRVIDAGYRVPAIRETRDYIRKVKNAIKEEV